MLPTSYFAGKNYGYDKAARGDALARDVARGLPPDALARRHAGRVFPDEAVLAERLEILREARAPLFAAAPSPSCGRRERLAPEVVAAHDLERAAAYWRATGEDPYLVLALPEERYVCAVEVTFALATPEERALRLEAFWMRSGSNTFEPGERSDAFAVRSSPTEQTVTVWVNDTIDRFRVDPDRAPNEFSLTRIVLVEPERAVP
jgi:hypothetical protein